MLIKFNLLQHNQMGNIQATKSMQNTLDRFPFVVIKQFAYDQIPTNGICLADKDIAGIEYISTDRLYDSCKDNTANSLRLTVCIKILLHDE